MRSVFNFYNIWQILFYIYYVIFLKIFYSSQDLKLYNIMNWVFFFFTFLAPGKEWNSVHGKILFFLNGWCPLEIILIHSTKLSEHIIIELQGIQGFYSTVLPFCNPMLISYLSHCKFWLSKRNSLSMKTKNLDSAI